MATSSETPTVSLREAADLLAGDALFLDVREQGEDRVIELIGYRYQRTGYQRIALDKRGWIRLEPVQLWLGLSRDRLGNYERLACFDRSGAEVGDYTAISTALAAEARARAEAEARATAEAEARARAEARIRELEERLRQN